MGLVTGFLIMHWVVELAVEGGAGKGRENRGKVDLLLLYMHS